MYSLILLVCSTPMHFFCSFTDPVWPGPEVCKATAAQFCEGVSHSHLLLPISTCSIIYISYPETSLYTGMFGGSKTPRSSLIRCVRIWRSPRWRTLRRLETNRMRWRRPQAPLSWPGSASDTSPWTMCYRYTIWSQHSKHNMVWKQAIDILFV